MKGSKARRQVSFLDAMLFTAMAAELVIMCWFWPNTRGATGTPLGILSAGASLLGAIIAARLLVINNQTVRLKRLLQRTLRRAEGAQRAERDRIARELHDGVSQMLLCARHTLETAAEPAIDSQQRAILLREGMEQLHDIIVEVRRVSHGYKSILLIGRDFTEALKVLGNDFACRTRIQMNLDDVDVAVDAMLTSRSKGALLRIAQEALANVQRHSGASHVQLAVQPGPDHIEMRVVDNGRCGQARIAGCNATPGIGISNMQERAAAVGGTLSVRFTGSHTEVVARVPPLRV